MGTTANEYSSTVLIVEDDETLQGLYKRFLGKMGNIDVLQAFSLEEAKELFSENKDRINIVVLDGNVPLRRKGSDSNGPGTTVDFAYSIRDHFNGPMIASSSDMACSRLLERAGCQYQAKKEEVPMLVIKLLSEEPKPFIPAQGDKGVVAQYANTL